MTATLEDRRAAAPVEPVAPTEPDEPPPLPPTTLLAELALLGVSLATIVGYARLFDDGAYFAPIALAAVLGHLLAAVLRRAHIGPLLATITHLAVLPLMLTALRYRETSTYLLPSGRTLDQLGDDLQASWEIFLDISAPVPAAPGFVVVAMATAWIVALVSDSLAFRLNATVEALAPATGLFLFSSILSDDRHRTTSAALFVFSVLAFVLASRVARADGTGRWLATDATRGTRSLLFAGAVLALVALVPAVLAGPRLPGGDGEPVVDLDGGGGSGDRVTLSPLVDIRSRLIDQSDVVAFRVEASSPAYWRLTALDDFDGQIWSSSGSYDAAEGELPANPDDDQQAPRVNQRYEIAALDQIWLPAAFEPVHIDSPDADVDYDAASSSLVVDSDIEIVGRPPLRSALDPPPRPARRPLRRHCRPRHSSSSSGTPGSPPPPRRWPASTPPRPSGARTTRTQQALALQNWFRSDDFQYSLSVQRGHGTDALASFLDPETGRVGYCEQFAGAYAALARSLGLPARVAVGFTPGEPDPDDPTFVEVRGLNAHAWPEVYFSGVGWVPFEPTPGRGNPAAELYTGVPADQATPDDPSTATTLVPQQRPAPRPQPAGPPDADASRAEHAHRSDG